MKFRNSNKTNTEVVYGLRSLEVCFLYNSSLKSETYRQGMKQIGKFRFATKMRTRFNRKYCMWLYY